MAARTCGLSGFLIGGVFAVTHRVYGLNRDVTLMHLMWLAKYDLVSLGGARQW